MVFNSIFKKEFEEFLNLRKAVLSKSAYAHDRSYLISFDTHLANQKVLKKAISEEIIIHWIRNLTGKSSSIANKVIVIRLFLNYLKGIGIKVFIPNVPKTTSDYVPYIFSDEELAKIFYLSDNIHYTKRQRNPYIQFEFPMILRLMYGCGLRIGETLALRMKDIDFMRGVLTLNYTKGNKQRLVPMYQNLTVILKRYCMAMGILGVDNALLFPTIIKESSLSVSAARNTFNSILKSAQIKLINRVKYERGPCLHCLRHVFSFKSFIEAEKSGRSIDDSIPYLSIFLGHDSLSETEHYLKFSHELYPDALALFDDFTLDTFPEVNFDD